MKILNVARPYSVDMRKAALALLEKGKTQMAVADEFGVNRRTIQRWLKLSKSGSVAPRTDYIRKPKKIAPEALMKYMDEHPDAPVKTVASFFNASPKSVYERLAALKIYKKKRFFPTRNAMKAKEMSFVKSLPTRQRKN